MSIKKEQNKQTNKNTLPPKLGFITQLISAHTLGTAAMGSNMCAWQDDTVFLEILYTGQCQVWVHLQTVLQFLRVLLQTNFKNKIYLFIAWAHKQQEGNLKCTLVYTMYTSLGILKSRFNSQESMLHSCGRLLDQEHHHMHCIQLIYNTTHPSLLLPSVSDVTLHCCGILDQICQHLFLHAYEGSSHHCTLHTRDAIFHLRYHRVTVF